MKPLAVFLTLLLFNGSCDNSESESSTSESRTDSITSVKPQQFDTLPIQPHKPKTDLSPSQARVKGRIIEISQINKTKATISFKVTGVLGYARTTPPIARHDTLLISIQDDSSFKQGNLMTAVIQYNLTKETSDKQPAWSFIKRES